jgi:hypothetical protein
MKIALVPEKPIIKLGDIGLEVFLSLNYSIITIQGENSFLPVFAIGNRLEVLDFPLTINHESLT